MHKNGSRCVASGIFLTGAEREHEKQATHFGSVFVMPWNTLSGFWLSGWILPRFAKLGAVGMIGNLGVPGGGEGRGRRWQITWTQC